MSRLRYNSRMQLDRQLIMDNCCLQRFVNEAEKSSLAISELVMRAGIGGIVNTVRSIGGVRVRLHG